ncbi:MAG: hypothetical protein HQ595_04355 [Candidatus Omnitrophica bacterium]|nr:hypothetical protein [Candidatus Omnitrophota bacterium]
MNKATLYIVILAVLCTGVGVVIGATVTKRQVVGERGFHKFGKMSGGFRDRMHKGMGGKLCKRLEKKLDLTAEQSEKVQVIMETSKDQAEQARDEFKAEIKQLKGNCHEQISAVLDPEQKEEYEDLQSRIKAKRGLMGKGCRREDK